MENYTITLTSEECAELARTLMGKLAVYTNVENLVNFS